MVQKAEALGQSWQADFLENACMEFQHGAGGLLGDWG